MPNQYKGGKGNTPQPCYGTTVPPDLGVDPLAAPFLPMVAASNPFQPCGSSACPTTSCCGGGGSGGGTTNGAGSIDPASAARRTARVNIA